MCCTTAECCHTALLPARACDTILGRGVFTDSNKGTIILGWQNYSFGIKPVTRFRVFWRCSRRPCPVHVQTGIGDNLATVFSE